METALIKKTVANIEQIKLFTGDLAFYNLIAGDFNKRTGGLTGPKKVSAVGAQIDAWLNENRKRSDKKEADSKIKTLVYKDVKSTSMYLDLYRDLLGINKADAAYRDMKEADAQGWITLDEYREFFERSGDWTPKHEAAYKRLISGEKLNKEDFQYFMPIKPMYFGPQTNSNGLYVPTYYKLSLMPLIPSLTKDTQLDDLREIMKNKKVGIAMFASANKVGANLNEDNKQLASFYDDNGKIAENNNIQEINYEYLGVQLDIAPIDKREVIFGTQFRKLILSNLFNKGVAKTIAVLRGDKMISVSGDSLKKSYDSTINKLTEIKRAKLIERMNISPQADGSFKINDAQKFKDVILKEAESRDVAENVIKSISLALDGDQKMIDATMSKNKIEQILYALVNNNVISQKMFGDMKVMGASTGFELKARKFKTLTVSEKENIEWIDDEKTLDFYHKLSNGSTSKMEVLLPSWFKEIVGSDISQIDSKLLELIGFRIPTQGLNSIDSIKVAGFLPKESGNLIITPSEIVGKAGSDYDIDKLSVFFPNYMMVSGKPQYIPTNKSDQEKLYNFVKESDSKYNRTLQEFFNDNEEAILQNKLLEISKEILSSPDMLAQLILPNSTDTLKAMVEMLRNASGKKVSKITGTKVIQFIENAKTAISFWSGKAGVGLAALHNTSHILAQQSGLFVGPNMQTYISLKHNSTVDGDIDLSSEFDANNKTRISDIINEFVNAYVDIAKDPFVFDLNAGVQTANVWLYLVRAGVPVETIAKFMKQPIVWDYIVAQSINESTLNVVTGRQLSKKQLIKSIRENSKYKTSENIEKAKFQEEELAKYIDPKNQTGKAFAIAQQAILTDFLEYQRASVELGRMMRYTNVDTKGAGKNRNSARNTIEGLNEVEQSKFFGNFDKYTNDSILKQFIKTVKDSSNYYNSIFVTDTTKIRDILNQLKSQFKKRGISDTNLNDIMDVTDNEMIAYLIQTQSFDGEMLSDKIDELFRGENSLAIRITKAKKNPALKKNYMLENLFPLISNNRSRIDNVKLYSKRMNVFEADQMSEAYLNLYDKDPGLADDITKLGILQSGVSNSPVSYLSVVPAEKFFEIASGAIGTALLSDNANISNFIDLFYQNNYMMKNVVKKLPSWTLGEQVTIHNGKMTINKGEEFYSNDVFLKTVHTNDQYETQKEKNDAISRGENIFITKLWKKDSNNTYTEIPTKGEGFLLKDYRKTDNVIDYSSEKAYSTNNGKTTKTDILNDIQMFQSLDKIFGSPKGKKETGIIGMTFSSKEENKPSNKLQESDKSLILTEEKLEDINVNLHMAGFKSSYTMEAYNALTNEQKKKLIECYS
jgi:predicted transcriptional regulator